MDTSETTSTTEQQSGILKRGLFPRREQREDQAGPPPSGSEARLDDLGRTAIDEQMQAGIEQMEGSAASLMREIAGEIWRTSSQDVRPEQERIMTIVAKDQTVRSLLATSDERFQAIAMRPSRREDNLGDLAESERRTRQAMEETAQAIQEVAQSPTLHGVEMVRTQLEQVERHIAETFTHFDERDREIASELQTTVKQHSELITSETARIVESMQAYVQGGAEAIGRLAQRIEEHAKLFVLQDHNITQSVIDAVGVSSDDVMGQLELIKEKVGLHGRDQDQLQAALERMIDARMRGLAELVRSDSRALQKLLEERNAASTVVGGEGQLSFDETTITRAIDERMSSLAQVVEERMDSLERTLTEQVLALSNASAASMDRNLEKMSTAAGQVDGLDELVAESQQVFQDRMLTHIDERMAQIARLVRSASEGLAGKIDEMGAAAAAPGETLDAELLRAVLRSVKELQAGMASDMLGTLDVRFQQAADQLHREGQEQAEAMLKVAEVLGAKIDRLSVRVDEGVGNDLQIVVDRMSDAIRAMSVVRRDIA